MRVPQVNERVKELPAQALRGVFAGIGQLLLVTDKLRNKTPAGQQASRASQARPASQARRPERSATAADTAAPAEKAPEVRDLGKTGNVRLLDDAGARASGAAKAARATAARAAEVPAAGEVPAAAEVPAAGEDRGAPLPNYDELSIASLRARLRNLDVGQVKEMAEYERAHAARADVVAMFERRIAKLEAGG